MSHIIIRHSRMGRYALNGHPGCGPALVQLQEHLVDAISVTQSQTLCLSLLRVHACTPPAYTHIYAQTHIEYLVDANFVTRS